MRTARRSSVHKIRGRIGLLAVFPTVLLLIVLTSCGEPSPSTARGPVDGPLRIGLLADYEGDLGNLGIPSEEGARYAVEFINAAGGVNGHPVELVVADGKTHPAVSVDAARKLVFENHVSAIVGPMSSAAALVVAGEVTIEARVPIISPSATTPQLTNFADDGFVFRSCLSDSTQGPALAWIARDAGLDQVAVLFRHDPYGIKLREVFEASYDGVITAAVAIEPEQSTYLDQLREATVGSPQALVAIAFAAEGQVFMREALDHDLFDAFIFSDAMSHQWMIDYIGGEQLEGIRGALPRGSGGVEDGLAQAWNNAFAERFGHPPSALSQATFDNVLCIALAAELADSNSSQAIRDTLATVSGGDGDVTIALDQSGVRQALEHVRAGRDIDYQGLSCSMDLTPEGDLATGSFQVYEIRNGQIQVVHELPVEAKSGTPPPPAEIQTE